MNTRKQILMYVLVSKMEALKVRALGMVAENSYRTVIQGVVAYGDFEFSKIADALDAISGELSGLLVDKEAVVEELKSIKQFRVNDTVNVYNEPGGTVVRTGVIESIGVLEATGEPIAWLRGYGAVSQRLLAHVTGG